jgi:hypothetical protein
MEKLEVFTKTELPNGGEATIYECKGKHYFKAILRAKGEILIISKYLILEVVKVNGKFMTEDEIDEMNVRDIAHLSEIVNSMLSNFEL